MEILWIIIVAGYALCVVQSIYSLTTQRPALEQVATFALAIALGAHTGWLLLQAFRAGRWPLVGTQESSAFLAWGLAVFYLVTARWYRANALKAFVFPIVLVLTTIAAFSPGTLAEPEGLNSPLQRILFPAHAGLLMLAYAAFFTAFGAGVMYLIQERELRTKRFNTIFYRLPSLETCDLISFKAMAVGFVMLTLGIAAGIAWQRTRDGQYWHGTGIEIFSVVTWVLYLLLIQSRITAGWGGRTSALVSIVSFMIVICSLIGVRYFGALHVTG